MAPCGLAHGYNHVGGDWAGNVYSSSGCPGSCSGEFTIWSVRSPIVLRKHPGKDFVNKNPGAFSHAFFEFSWIKVYQ